MNFFFHKIVLFDRSSSWASEHLMIVVGLFIFFDKIFFDGWFFHVNVIFFSFCYQQGGWASVNIFFLFLM
jgi:hypothetical protein